MKHAKKYYICLSNIILPKMFYLLTLFCFFNSTMPALQARKGAVEIAVNRLTDDLMAKYSSNSKVRVAILQFRTPDDNISRFNQLVQNEMNSVLAESVDFQTIEQFSVNHIVDEFGWNLQKASSSADYSLLNESLFKVAGVIADIFICGIIQTNEDEVIITAYLLPDGLVSEAKSSTVRIPISDIPSHLLDDK